MTLALFAGLRVRDLAVARAWYDRLFGAEPSFHPHATEAVWELADQRFVYVVEHPQAGGSAVTLFVGDLDARLDALAARGLEPTARETYGNGTRKVTFHDPDGNEIGFAGPPATG